MGESQEKPQLETSLNDPVALTIEESLERAVLDGTMTQEEAQICLSEYEKAFLGKEKGPEGPFPPITNPHTE